MTTAKVGSARGWDGRRREGNERNPMFGEGVKCRAGAPEPCPPTPPGVAVPLGQGRSGTAELPPSSRSSELRAQSIPRARRRDCGNCTSGGRKKVAEMGTEAGALAAASFWRCEGARRRERRPDGTTQMGNARRDPLSLIMGVFWALLTGRSRSSLLGGAKPEWTAVATRLRASYGAPGANLDPFV